MSPLSYRKKTDFIPLSVAVTLVPYSRDYIGRLARSGKITAEHVDKQWCVSEQSLTHFFAQSDLEDSVKKRILSVSRKNDLEVRDFYTQTITEIKSRQHKLGNASLAMAVLIICGGLGGGLFLQAAAVASAEAPNASLTYVLSALTAMPNQATVVAAYKSKPATMQFSDQVVLEQTDKIPMQGGVVLFPSLKSEDTEMVQTLFSDEVSVVVTSTTTGFVRAKNSDRELPFVRIPTDPAM